MLEKFNRKASLEAEPILHEEPSSIELFIDSHADDLQQSALEWGKVANTLRWVSTDEQVSASFRTGVAKSLELGGHHATQGRVEQTANILQRDFTAYIHVSARVESLKKESIMGGFKGIRDVLQRAPNRNVVGIIGGKDFPRFALNKNVLEMVEHMRTTDKITDKVLNNLCKDYIKTPHQIKELELLYKDGAENVHPLLSELHNMITVDWYRKDPEKSVLRKHVKSLTDDPSLHVEAFCNEVAINKTAASVRTMSLYALASSGITDPTNEDIFKQLLSTKDVWSGVSDLQESFNKYVEQSNNAIAMSINTIAGTGNSNNVRTEKGHEELDILVEAMVVIGDKNAVSSRNAQRKRKHNGSAKLGIANATEMIRQLDDIEVRKEKPVAIAKFANGRGYELTHLQEVNINTLVENFDIDNAAAKSMVAAVEYIRKPNHSIMGTRRLMDREIRMNNKKYGLWRFAPDKAAGLKIDSAHRFYRIVYTTVDGVLALATIQTHADFDKTYGG